MSATDTLRGYVDASTRSVTADNTIEYAYRDLGDSDLPQLLGTAEGWQLLSYTNHF